MKRKGYHEFNLLLTEEEINALIKYKWFFDKHSKLNNKIPARITKNLLDLYTNALNPNRLVDIDFDLLKTYTKEKFKEYYFEEKIKTDIPFQGVLEETISLHTIIDNCINSIINDLEDFEQEKKRTESIEKEALFNSVFDYLNDECLKLKPKSRKVFSAYCIGAMSAFICHEIGYPFPTQKSPTVRDFHQSARNLIEKHKKRGNKL